MSESSLPYGDIVSVHFYITGDDENKEDGFIRVKHKDTLKSGNLPYKAGIYDALMGTTDNSWICLSCQNRKELCPGHSGYIQLKYPMQNPMFKDELFKWLKIICHSCGSLLTDKILTGPTSSLFREYQKKIVQGSSKSAKKLLCPTCGIEHPNIVRDKFQQLEVYKEYLIDDKPVREQIMNRKSQRSLIVSDETMHRVGRPLTVTRKFIINYLNVPSNVIRPDMKRMGGTKVVSTILLYSSKHIVILNDKLPDHITDVSDLKLDIRNLDLNIFEMIRGSSATNKTKTRITHMSNKPPASLASRMPRKPGRVRGTMMGKRTHNCCRSVISGDPNLRIDEIGVPILIAKKIQIPITVHPWNINELMIYFTNKDTQYPGCTRVKKRSGGTYYVGNIREDFRLEIGDIIYRDLIDGDVMAFNRTHHSPHQYFCHKVRIRTSGRT